MTTFYLNGLLFLQDYYIFFKLMLTDIFCVCVCLLVVCMLNACAYLCVCLCVRACLQPQQSLQQCLLPATNQSSPTCSTRVCFRLEWLTSSSSPLCVHHRPACDKTSSASMYPVTHLVPALQPYPSIPISSSIID